MNEIHEAVLANILSVIQEQILLYKLNGNGYREICSHFGLSGNNALNFAIPTIF